MIELLLQADRQLTVDLVDQAQATYQRVADQDPNNAIAVVGLARCALARGEDRDAYALAARALVIDPENDMARRMEARMAEVLTYRGESLPDMAPVPGHAPVVTEANPDPSVTTTATVVPSASAARSTPADVTSTSRTWLRRIRGR